MGDLNHAFPTSLSDGYSQTESIKILPPLLLCPLNISSSPSCLLVLGSSCSPFGNFSTEPVMLRGCLRGNLNPNGQETQKQESEPERSSVKSRPRVSWTGLPSGSKLLEVVIKVQMLKKPFIHPSIHSINIYRAANITSYCPQYQSSHSKQDGHIGCR